MNKEGLNIKLKPYASKDLIRIGCKSDGGYVVNKEILNKSKNLITLGLSDEFSFEKHYSQLFPTNNILVYDHTVNKNFWVKNIINWFFHFIRNFKNFKRIFRFFDYYLFFRKEKINHFKLKIVSKTTNSKNSISIEDIINKNKIIPNETILKIDIDMDEYRILEDILEYDFLSIVIEFSHTDLLMDKILNFVEKLKNYKIIHIHGNNFDPPDKNGNPIYLEITYANSKYIDISTEHIDYNLPLKEIDFPNDTKKEEIPIKFVDD